MKEKGRENGFLALQGNSGWKGPRENSSPPSCSGKGQLCDHTRSCSASCSLVLEISKHRDLAASWGNLLCCPYGEKLFYQHVKPLDSGDVKS